MNHLAKRLTHLLQTRWGSATSVLAVVLVLITCISIGHAQSGVGSIQGTVTDSTGAVIPSADIHVVNQDTSIATDTKSNGVGFYQVPGLFRGAYSITITAPGMKTYKQTLVLLVAQNAVVNATLTAGEVTQQVNVSADTVDLTTTDNGTVNATLENQRINQLPMNGRNMVTLVMESTPGMESRNGLSANGLMSEALDYEVDGAPLNDREFGGTKYGQVAAVDPDAVQEVKVETSGSSAQYSEPATAVVSTKSGTNRLHGSLFETARNNAIGIAKGRANPWNYVAPEYIRNEFGASAGGPILLPKIYNGINKSFWFFAFERYSLAQKASYVLTVPTTAMRGGDFSGLTNSSGVLQQLYDPATTTNSTNCNGTGKANPYCRTPFANNQIPTGRISPTGKVLYDILPKPTSSANPLVQANLTYLEPTFTVIPQETFRFDHAFNENNRAYLRYTQSIQTEFDPRNQPTTVAADGIPANAVGMETLPEASFATAIGFTHVFSPNFFMETVLSNQWFSYYDRPMGPNTNYESMLGLPNNFGETGFPYLNGDTIMTSPNLTGITGSELQGTMFAYGMSQIVSSIDENITKIMGKHQLNFGGRYRHERFGSLPDRSFDYVNLGTTGTGLYDTTSGANYTSVANTGYSQGDWFLGAADSYQVSLEPPYEHFHDMEFDAYIQDGYHFSRNLTLNIGLRYEAHPAPWTKYNLMESFDLKNDAVVLAAGDPSNLVSSGYTTSAIINNLKYNGAKFETASAAGMPATTLINNYNLNFSPRIGFAYQPFNARYGTVLRGAYGRYIYPQPIRTFMRMPMMSAPLVASYAQSYIAANQSPDGLPNYLLRSPQSVIMGTNSSNVVNTSTTTSILPGQVLNSINPKMPPDFVTDVNFTIEQPLKGHSAIRLSYIWTHGTNLDQEYFYNQQPSTYVWEMQKGITPPTGGASVIGTSAANTYAATAMGPYDQTTWGSNVWIQKSGFSNDNELEVNYERLYHHGLAFQAFYVWSKAFRVGGNGWRDGKIYPAQDYVGSSGNVGSMTTIGSGTVMAANLPPTRPSSVASYENWHALNVYENYIPDGAIPAHHIRFNGIVDLPFGTGKRLIGNANRLINELVGGFQLAGDTNISTQFFQVGNGNFGGTNPIKLYKHSAPIVDCRSGVCYREYLWFNGYIAPTANANSGYCNANYGVGNTSGGVPKCVYGLPSDYVPYEYPINNVPGVTGYGTNNVAVTLSNNSTVTVPYSPGPTNTNRYSKTFLNGPINWTADLSLFKVFPITESTNLRFNLDAFNLFNVQGFNNPNGTDGTQAILPNGISGSYNTPRQLQFTLRLTF